MGRHGGGAFSGKDPTQGGPQRGVHGPLGRQERRGGWPGDEREMQFAYAIGHPGSGERARGDVRHRHGA